MPLSRRDFLKLFGVTAGGAAVAPYMPPIPPGAPVAAVPAVANAVEDALDDVDLPDAMPHLLGDETRAIPMMQTTRLTGGAVGIYLNGKRLERVRRFSLDMNIPEPEYMGVGIGTRNGGIKGSADATLRISAFGQDVPIPLDTMQPVDIEIRERDGYSIVLQASPANIKGEWGVGQLAVYEMTFVAVGDVCMVQTVL